MTDPAKKTSRARRSLLATARRALTAMALVGLLGACAEDKILPVPSTCGNGVVSGDEECDPTTPSPGCVQCVVQPGWKCPDTSACATTCGDNIQAGDEECDSTDRASCDSACRKGTRMGGCDATGWWATRQTTFSIDDVFNEIQTTSNWFLWHLVQTAPDGSLEVDHSLNCGIQVSGSKVDVHLTPTGIDALIHKAAQDGSGGRPKRKGRSYPVPGTTFCAMEMERSYFVRGCDESLLPAQTSAPWPDLATLTPLPTEANPQGATDDDGDGNLGIAWQVSRGASGIRNTAQRDWAEYFAKPNETDTRYQIVPNALEIEIRANFKNEEQILKVTNCPPIGCGPLRAGSKADDDLQHRIHLLYLGADLNDPRVKKIVTGMPNADKAADSTTCTNVRTALPHDGTSS